MTKKATVKLKERCSVCKKRFWGLWGVGVHAMHERRKNERKHLFAYFEETCDCCSRSFDGIFALAVHQKSCF